jgi:hypothetical protein
MDMMNQEKIKALQELIGQMQDLMIEGKGDDEMSRGDVSESIEEAMEGAESPEMGEECEEKDPLAEERKNFMKGIVDRPKRKSMVVKPKAPVAMMSVKETIALPKKKAKGK